MRPMQSQVVGNQHGKNGIACRSLRSLFEKCNSGEPDSHALGIARDTIVLACEKYREQSRALQKASRFVSDCLALRL